MQLHHMRNPTKSVTQSEPVRLHAVLRAMVLADPF